MKRYFKWLPNALTLGNLFCGVLGLLTLWNPSLLVDALWGKPDVILDYYRFPLYLIFLGMVFDAFDGQAARLLDAKSPVGHVLDGLSDMVTFGVLPGAMMVHHLLGTLPHFVESPLAASTPIVLIAVPLFYIGSAAYRLARYTAFGDEESKRFKGSPTPAAAGVVAALLLGNLGLGQNWGQIAWLIIPIALGLLMISKIPLLSFKGLQDKVERPWIIVLLAGGLACVLVLGPVGFGAAFLLYLALSLIRNFAVPTKSA